MVRAPRNSNARVIHEDIGDSVARCAELRNRAAPLFRCKIGDHGSFEVAACILDSIAQRIIADVGEYQFRPRGTELAHHLAAKAAAGTGNQDGLVEGVGHGQPCGQDISLRDNIQYIGPGV